MRHHTRGLLLVLLCATSATMHAQVAPGERPADHARIDWHQVAAPAGNFLIIRGTEGLCAIRFTDLQRDHDAKPGTAFHSGAEHQSAGYEWYFLNKGQGNFTDAAIPHGQARVATGPLVGVGRLAFQTSDAIVRCGPMKNFWLPPAALSFSDRVSCKVARYAIAPTAWKVIAQVDPSDEQLKWFQCDQTRKTFTFVPVVH